MKVWQPPIASIDPIASVFVLFHFVFFFVDMGRGVILFYFWIVAPTRASSLRLGLKSSGEQPAITKWIDF